MERILTLKEQLGKFFFAKHLDFLTSVPQRRIQEIILSSCTRGNRGKITGYVIDHPLETGTVIIINRLSAKGTDEVMKQEVLPHKMCYNGHGMFGKLQQSV